MKILLAAAMLLSPIAAQAQDWSGAYGALGLQRSSGTDTEYSFGLLSAVNDVSGNQVSLALGYGFQSGNFVYGAELGYSTGKIQYDAFSAENYIGEIVDLKARVGYAAGRTLWYGTLGLARANRYYGNVLVDDPIASSGHSFGFGVSRMVNDRIFVGLDVQERRLSIDEGDVEVAPQVSSDISVRSVELRVGIKF